MNYDDEIRKLKGNIDALAWVCAALILAVLYLEFVATAPK